MNLFRYIIGANYEIRVQMENWRNKSIEYINSIYKGDITQVQGTIFGNCISKIVYLAEMATTDAENFRGVIDINGQLQAGAIVEDYSGYLSIDTLVNAPWNVVKNQPETVRGAATSLVEEIVRESITLGYNGIVKALSLPQAKVFYRKIGFHENENFENEMELTPRLAQEFLAQQLIRKQQ